MLKKKRFLISGIILLFAFGFLIAQGLQGCVPYYYVNEFLAEGSSPYDGEVQVNGEVVPGSIVQESAGLILRFTIAKDGKSLPVFYQGVVPDTFKEGQEVVVKGRLNSDGVFQADKVMPKCPSRYEAQS